jgi:putative SOS response-associated peptidase YedK
MCGRFTQAYTWHELYELYRLTCPPVNTQPSYNIAPTTMIDVVAPHEAGRDLVSMRWGLIPSWWKKTAKEVPSTFNARAETVATKPMFRAAFKRGRCLIPASGYFEWRPTPAGKQPYYISAANGSVLSMAGLWDQWTDIETGARVRSCTIIVTSANSITRAIHDRMPVLIEPKDFGPWLSGAAGTELLGPAPDDYLRLWPASKRVNRTGNVDDPTLIEKISLGAV